MKVRILPLILHEADLRKAADTFRAPPDVRAAARRALEVRAKSPESQQGMTPVGLARARQLAYGEPVSIETIRRMVSYFARHEVDKLGTTWDEKGKGWQAWNGWGGDAGKQWAERVLREHEAQLAKSGLAEVPAWLLKALGSDPDDLDGLEKGKSHKYIRRVPYTGKNGKTRWRYYYHVTGLGHHDEIKRGASFAVAGGHLHVVHDFGDGFVHVVHDETGNGERVSKEALAGLLREHHAEAIAEDDSERAKKAERAAKNRTARETKAKERPERLKRELEAVSKPDSKATPKQRARIEAEAAKTGVSLPKPEPKPKSAESVPRGEHQEVGSHVAGSRKDLAVGTSFDDIFALPMEEAAKLIVKAKLIPKYSEETYKAEGKTPGAYKLRRAIEAHAAPQPPNSKPEVRVLYAKAIAFLSRTMDGCKSVDDIHDALTEWAYLASDIKKVGEYATEYEASAAAHGLAQQHYGAPRGQVRFNRETKKWSVYGPMSAEESEAAKTETVETRYGNRSMNPYTAYSVVLGSRFGKILNYMQMGYSAPTYRKAMDEARKAEQEGWPTEPKAKEKKRCRGSKAPVRVEARLAWRARADRRAAVCECGGHGQGVRAAQRSVRKLGHARGPRASPPVVPLGSDGPGEHAGPFC